MKRIGIGIFSHVWYNRIIKKIKLRQMGACDMDRKDIFLRLFSAFLRKESVVIEERITEEEWKQLFRMASYHQIVPMLYEIAMTQESFCQLPEEQRQLWKQETLITVAKQAHKTNEFLRLYRLMREKGIHPLVVKGIVCRDLYPKPDHRPSCDEDLLVAKEEIWKLDELLLKEGFTREITDDSMKENIESLHEVGYRNWKTGMYLEVHLTLFPEESAAYGSFNNLFQGAASRTASLSINGCEILTLSPTDHFLYLLCHSAKHFMHSGFGVRQLADLLLFAERYGHEIHWDYVIEKTKEYHIYVFMIHLFDIGVRYFSFSQDHAGWPQDKIALDGRLDSEDLLQDLLVGGVFGASTGERLHSANITLSAVEHGDKKGKLWSSLFPDRRYMERNYDYVRDHSWLLPVGWIHRMVKFLWKDTTDSRKVLETGEKRVDLLKKYQMIP